MLLSAHDLGCASEASGDAHSSNKCLILCKEPATAAARARVEELGMLSAPCLQCGPPAEFPPRLNRRYEVHTATQCTLLLAHAGTLCQPPQLWTTRLPDLVVASGLPMRLFFRAGRRAAQCTKARTRLVARPARPTPAASGECRARRRLLAACEQRLRRRAHRHGHSGPGALGRAASRPGRLQEQLSAASAAVYRRRRLTSPPIVRVAGAALPTRIKFGQLEPREHRDAQGA